MKVVFVGPSLHRHGQMESHDIAFRPPAYQGDIYDAVCNGANVIGIVDGLFESMSSIWHKEILYALSEGVQVFGASSMGALRAAECAAFGMIGVGQIFEAYRDGRLVDDDAVALIHGPAELGYLPLSVPLFNVLWTVEEWRQLDLVTAPEAGGLVRAAETIHFKDRTWKTIIEEAGLSPDRAMAVAELAETGAVDRKALDCIELINVISRVPDERGSKPGWVFSRTEQFERFLANRHNSAHSVTAV